MCKDHMGSKRVRDRTWTLTPYSWPFTVRLPGHMEGNLVSFTIGGTLIFLVFPCTDCTGELYIRWTLLGASWLKGWFTFSSFAEGSKPMPSPLAFLFFFSSHTWIPLKVGPSLWFNIKIICILGRDVGRLSSAWSRVWFRGFRLKKKVELIFGHSFGLWKSLPGEVVVFCLNSQNGWGWTLASHGTS